MNAVTLKALLDLDPFVAGGPAASLPADRFRPYPGQILSDDGRQTLELEFDVTRTEERSEVRSEVTTEDLEKGFLSFLGLGPQETATIRTTISTRSSTSFRRGQTVTARAVFEGTPPGTDRVRVFYDTLFGTYAFQSPR